MKERWIIHIPNDDLECIFCGHDTAMYGCEAQPVARYEHSDVWVLADESSQRLNPDKEYVSCLFA